MSLDCEHRRTFGPDICQTACHAIETGAFLYARADRPADVPPRDASIVDVFVLDMSRLVIDRALNGPPSGPWPQWEQMLGWGRASGFVGQPR